MLHVRMVTMAKGLVTEILSVLSGRICSNTFFLLGRRIDWYRYGESKQGPNLPGTIFLDRYRMCIHPGI